MEEHGLNASLFSPSCPLEYFAKLLGALTGEPKGSKQERAKIYCNTTIPAILPITRSAFIGLCQSPVHILRSTQVFPLILLLHSPASKD
jgi:hypothetical protein